MNPAALRPAELARLLGLPEAAVAQHVAQGAPCAGGVMNLVHYAAWLLATDGANVGEGGGDG